MYRQTGKEREEGGRGQSLRKLCKQTVFQKMLKHIHLTQFNFLTLVRYTYEQTKVEADRDREAERQTDRERWRNKIVKTDGYLLQKNLS